jgi:hypothetical protein
MKNPLLLSAGIVLTLVSCAGDADTAARKKSVSIGRFGVTHNAAPEVPADAPVAIPVQGAPVDASAAVAQQQAAPEPAKPKPVKTVTKDRTPSRPEASNGDGIRLPSMLGLPEDKDLKATNPTVPKSGNEGGAVISRPPAEKKE